MTRLLNARLRMIAAITLSGFITAAAFGQQGPAEVPKGSELRARLFDVARSQAEKIAGQKIKFHGSLKRLGDWAYFGGFLVDSNGRKIVVDELSSYCLVLWHREGGAWRVLDFGAGANEPYHLEEWPRKFGTPLELISE